MFASYFQCSVTRRGVVDSANCVTEKENFCAQFRGHDGLVPCESGIVGRSRPCFSVHPGGTRIYKDLEKAHWWQEIKRDIAEYAYKCLICLQVKAEHMKVAEKL